MTEYALFWTGAQGREEIDCVQDEQEAIALRDEYQMAFGGDVEIEKREVKT